MDFFDFDWPRDEGGYEIKQPRKPKRAATSLEEYAPTHYIQPSGGPITTTRPLKHFPYLFLTFAETSKTPNGVNEFADRYGLLKGNERESLDEWYEAIDAFKQSVAFNKDDFWESTSGDLEAQMPRSFTAVLVRRSDNRLPSLLVRPTTLYAAMWLQYASWVSAPGINYRWCAWCNKPFLYGPTTGRRSRARYCEPKCQKAHAYAKKKERDQ